MIQSLLHIVAQKTGYVFKDKRLLTQALTHPGFVQGRAQAPHDSHYERLEFLGDRVLGLSVAELLFTRFPNEPEGSLSRRHAPLVSGKTCAVVAQLLGLGEIVRLDNSEITTGGAENKSILADVMEALIGAVYIDGGFDEAKTLVTKLWVPLLEQCAIAPKDTKSAVQEWVQGQGLPLPEYRIIGRTGPDHAPEFVVALCVKGFDTVQAKGKSRKEAEKCAATLFLEQTGQNT